MKAYILIISILLLVMTSCSSTTNYKMLSNENIGKFDPTKNQGEYVEGEGCSIIILGNILGANKVETAIDNALSKVEGATTLINVQVTSEISNYFLGGQICLYARGYAVN